jgi:hypothetical protein
MSDDLLKAKAGVSAEGANAELVIGENLPGAIARLFPGRWAKSQALLAITNRIVEKIKAGDPLDTADAQFAAAAFAEPVAKWVRCQQIAALAGRVLEQPEVAGQLPPIQAADSPSSDGGKVTADDWLSRFWDDAGLVSDDMLQEIYARILASEAVHPGSCSLRTLKVLRYLDRDTAESFAKLMPGVFDSSWVPSDQPLREQLGLTADLVLDLSDAGLVDPIPFVTNTITSDRCSIRYGKFILYLENCKGLQYGIHPLTRPGQELARIAEVVRNQENFISMVRWIASKKPDVKSRWTEMPHEGWKGTIGELTWFQLPPESMPK